MATVIIINVTSNNWPYSEVGRMFTNHIINFKNVTQTSQTDIGLEVRLGFAAGDLDKLQMRIEQIDAFAREFECSVEDF